MKKVLKYNEMNIQNLVYDDPIKVKNYIISKIWYNDNNIDHTLNIQLPNLNIYQLNSNSIILSPTNEIEAYFENLDNITMKYINDNDFLTKFGLDNVRYKTLINEVQDDHVLKLKIINNKKPTQFYLQNKNILNHEEAHDMLSKTTYIKTILEIDAVIIDLENKIMFTNVITKQILLPTILPQKVELVDYSFIDSEQEQEKKEEYEEDIILNVETDNINTNNTNTNQESKKLKKKYIKKN